MRSQTILKTAFGLALCAALPLAHANTITSVSLFPAGFGLANDGPFYLDFTLTGTAGNTVELSGFTFGLGAPVEGTETLTGDTSGSLSSTIDLGDGPASFFNDFYQEFTPGTAIDFSENITNIDGGTPDTLTMSLLDSSLLPIPTLDPSGANTLFTITLGSSPTFVSYASDTSQSTSDLTYPVIPAAVFTPAPEVSTWPCTLAGLAMVLLARRRRLASACAVMAGFAALAPAQTCQPLYQPAGSPITVATGREATGVALADFDGDGIPDMAIGTSLVSGSAQLILLKGNGSGGFSPFGGSPVTVSSLLLNAGNIIALRAADFTHDGKMDLLVATDQGSILVFTGNGNGTVNVPASALMTLPVNFGPPTIAVADLNGDGFTDAVVTGGHTYILLNSGGTLSIVQALTSEPQVWVGDLNNDGYPDLVGITGKIYLNNTHGSFTQSSTVSIPNTNSPINMAIGDFTGDGKADLLFTSPSSDGLSIVYEIFPGDGAGNLAAGTLVASGVVISAPVLTANITVGDFNGDGHMDFAMSQRNGTTTELFVFEGNSGAGFAQAPGSPFTLGSSVKAAQVASLDLNADGIFDIVATSISSSTGNGEAFVFLANSQTATVGISTSANPGITGASLTLRAVVGGASACAGPTGQVTFSDGGIQLGTENLLNGQATLTLPSGLTTGVHNLKATFSGGNGFHTTSGQYVEFIGSASCSPNLIGQVTVKPGGFVYDRTRQQFVQTVAVTNNGPSAIIGPISLALDSLSTNATLASPSGYTSCALPANSPMADLGICPDSPLNAGATASVTLRFNDPTLAAISYAPRVLGGLTLR